MPVLRKDLKFPHLDRKHVKTGLCGYHVYDDMLEYKKNKILKM